MQINNVEPAYIEKYSKTLVEAKTAKTEAALNKVFDRTFACYHNFACFHLDIFIDLSICIMLFSLLTTVT